MPEPSIYLSYVAADQAYGDRLRTALLDLSITVVDPVRDVVPGTDWAAAIRDKLRAVAGIVFIIGETTYRSEIVEDEARLAGELGKPVILAKTDAASVIPRGLYSLRARWTTIDEAATACLELAEVSAPV